ncbi:MAG: patatin-like phospholipase RssA [Thiobacillaceae bacterium]|nr:patatin-like phospholipase RssA [Thiobacillaceae bacterium]MCX7672589.1 patatin-like phospholipase RssA [Thiobacillaceae bacterium]MDW8322529.1 patatin-like phospholipase RssA [Burkholderiales bacterium]
MSHRPIIGLALGSGSARGWAHIGAIRALAELGITPRIVCGTSIGALVGAAYAAGRLERLEAWVCSLKLQGVVSFFDFSLNGGMLKGARLMEFFRTHFEDRPIEALDLPYGAVATDLASGREVWLREGSLLDAVRASIALPGLFTPVLRAGRWLVDGGLVNPVPVTLARALGAEVVIAVDLNTFLIGRHLRKREPAGNRPAADSLTAALMQRLQALPLPWREADEGGETPPSLFDTLATSLNIMQVQISRSRLAGEPPDVLITPRVAHLGLLEFHRAREAIAEGRRAVHSALPQLRALELLA